MPNADIVSRFAEVRRRIAEAARQAERDPASIALVAVSKTQPVEVVRSPVLWPLRPLKYLN